ncbi:hypothetical protein [Streptomyces sp. NPDC049906]|uniref:hypothetical protein n=1 Tax=Streptomyces sp. NPDC049906 TaxID=3155656 RepID=UPI00343BB52D
MNDKLEQLKPLVPAFNSIRFKTVRQLRSPNEVSHQQPLRPALTGRSHNEVHAATFLRFERDVIDRTAGFSYAAPAGMEPLSGGWQL